MNTIRYVWNGEARYLYPSITLKGEKILVPTSRHPIFVNILERASEPEATLDLYKVRLFYSDGTILDGWVLAGIDPIDILNKQELFDGRFNS